MEICIATRIAEITEIWVTMEHVFLFVGGHGVEDEEMTEGVSIMQIDNDTFLLDSDSDDGICFFLLVSLH